MSQKMKTLLGIVLLIVAVGAKLYNAYRNPEPPEKTPSSDLVRKSDEKVGRYYVLRNCTYVPDRKYNDGDSFKVKSPDGRVVEVRMYFVDTAESKDKHYDDYRRRVADQGKDFGGLNYQETIKLGQEAKKFAESQLRDEKMTIYTAWEEVYDSGRYYAFVKLENGQWWHQMLVERGLARIHTKGADLPGGPKRRVRESQLRALEKEAKKARVGAWRR